MVEDIIEKFTAGRVFENDTNVSVCLDLVDQTHNVGVLNPAKDGNFAVNLSKSRGVASNAVPLDELDGNLLS